MLKRLLHFSTLTFLFLVVSIASCKNNDNHQYENEEEEEGYDGAEMAQLFEIERTKDPATGKVPTQKMWAAIQFTEAQKNASRNNANRIEALAWQERGPNGDFTVGGNPRPTGQQTSGRIRAAIVDSTDPTKKTVWVGGVDGGLWKTTDITAKPSAWTLINDFLSNLAISAICQDPRPGFQQNIYFCTGESFRNADAVRGVGVFKSTNGGSTWNFLTSSSSFLQCTRILCDYQGNIYLGTRGNGLQRSNDGGATWTNITPSGVNTSIADLEISTTGGPARLHMTTGIGSAQVYRYTDIPASVTNTVGWNSATTAFPALNERCELGILGNTLYALPVDASSQVPTIYKSTDGGENWAATISQPASGWASGQGWYSLSCGINPTNSNECIVGGLDCYKTSDGGNTWVKISSWATSSTGFYVHADQHNVQWWDNGNKLLFACDGGIHYSTDRGVTNDDRNQGLRIKQFYSVAIHPTLTNYFIGGTQDNGMHRMNHPGLDSSAEVVGGDGCYSAIDQNEPQFQFGSYVFNVYRRSTNNGATWTTPVNNTTTGRFVNPWDYDNNTNIIYGCNGAGNFFRWNNPQTGSTTEVINVSAFGTGNVSAVHCSPYTPHRVFFGMGSGTLFKVDDANTASPIATNITPAGASGYLNCIVTGSSDNNLIATYSSYGVINVWLSNNGGTTWTASDGNLPDMPVRWALFHPDTDTKAFIATETGVWETDLLNGGSTVWNAGTSFPTVRTDMIKYRSSDRTIAAGTHGRGIWTANIPLPTGFSFGATTTATATCPAPNSMSVSLPVVSNGGFTNAVTLSVQSTSPSGLNVAVTSPVTPGNNATVFLNNANTLSPGTYTATILGTAASATNQTATVTFTINPGAGPAITGQPSAQNVCAGSNASFSVTASGTYQWQLSTDGGNNWANIGGATSATLSLTAVTAGMNNNQYRCIVTGQCGSTNSAAATLTVSTPASITAQPADATICAGQQTQLCVTATGTNLTYQWQSATSCTGSFSNIGGATNNCINVTPATTTSYRCVVTSTGVCGTTINSGCATVIVVSSVTITTQPTSQTVCEGATVGFIAAGSGTGLTYQWQLSTDGGSNYNNIGGATAATYNAGATTVAMNGNRYRCVISNGICPTPGTTNEAVLTVNTLPAISSNPQSVTLCVGSGNTFSVAANGTGISYQWQLSTDGGGSYSNIGGANASSYAVTGVTVGMNNNRYRCVVSGACTPAATSAAAVLTVIAPVTIANQPTNAEICSGNNTSFTVVGSSTQPIIYQWQVSTDGVNYTNISGANSATLTLNGVTALMNGNRYRVQLSNATCSAPATSNAVLLTVRALPTIGLTASELTLFPGKNSVLTATPSAQQAGAALTTSWTYNGNPLAVSGNTYTANVEKVGVYQVRIQESWGASLICTAISQAITINAGASSSLFIFPSPNDGNFTVSYYNQSTTATSRTLAIFDSKGAMVYNRSFNINGAYTLLPVNLQTANRGIYYVVIGDASGNRLAEGKVHVR